MELALNLAWMLLAAGMIVLWLRHAPRRGAGRLTQVAALAVTIFILLPAISMTDDLLAAQKPAEVDCCSVRRDHGFVSPHAVSPAAAVPPPVFAGLRFVFLSMAEPLHPAAPHVEQAALLPIQNRPPPVA